jgi:2-oxo-4-hydroxy-4-carboxy-5-ureidoimidazoline decarboxylase
MSAEPAALTRFNELPADAAVQQLAAVCASPSWAAAMAAGRPYATVADAQAHSDAAVTALSAAGLATALAGHPRIGERPAADQPGQERSAGWSRREQAEVHAADAATMGALAEANAAYEQRFGHIYLVCAAGRTGAELLALLQERLGNDDETEWRVVRAELGKINQIRLGELLGGRA